MKFEDKNDFAEKTVNKIPFVKTMNIKVTVTDHSITYTPREGKVFYGGNEITSSFMDRLGGIIDGLRYAYDELENNYPTKKKLISILSNPKYWCPSKKEQWDRMANAILKK